MYCGHCKQGVRQPGVVHCPRCGSPLQPEFMVALRPTGRMRQGDVGVLELLIRNPGPPVSSLIIELESRLFQQRGHARLGRLATGAETTVRLPVGRVEESGASEARLTIGYRADDGMRYAFVGQTVLQTTAADGGNYVINISGKVLGSKLSLGEGQRGEEVSWAIVELYWDETATRRQAALESRELVTFCPFCQAKIPRNLRACPACGMDLPSYLHAHRRAPVDGAAARLPRVAYLQVRGARTPVRVLVGPEVQMGRLPENNIPLLVPPTSPYHQHSVLISRVGHCRLVIEDEVPVVRFKYPQWVRGEEVSGFPVVEERRFAVATDNRESSREVIVELDCRPFFLEGPEGRVCLGLGLVPYYRDASGFLAGGMNLVVYRHLDLAPDRKLGLAPVGDGQEGILRVLQLDGRLWLEPLVPELPLEVAGQPQVPTGEIVPLSSGQDIRCGPASFYVHVPE